MLRPANGCFLIQNLIQIGGGLLLHFTMILDLDTVSRADNNNHNKLVGFIIQFQWRNVSRKESIQPGFLYRMETEHC